jgi:hypothetical protein
MSFGLIDKILSMTLDNASSNVKAIETLTPMFTGYLGSDPAPHLLILIKELIALFINVVLVILLTLLLNLDERECNLTW